MPVFSQKEHGLLFFFKLFHFCGKNCSLPSKVPWGRLPLQEPVTEGPEPMQKTPAARAGLRSDSLKPVHRPKISAEDLKSRGKML